ncbi:hypothetical protein BDB01DRAFT_777295 [Pilobolus umbonatus]|nr:hypothetical protein BDB01DRAFT_777295 [Pilobolus umbonatus]
MEQSGLLNPQPTHESTSSEYSRTPTTEESLEKIMSAFDSSVVKPTGAALEIAGEAIGIAGRSADAAISAASRLAFNIMSGIFNPETLPLNNTHDGRDKRREVRRQKRAEVREMKERLKDAHSDSFSSGPFHDGFPKDNKGKQRLDSEKIPDDNLIIHKSWSAISVNESWRGNKCDLRTSNATIAVKGSLEASNSISVETSNGTISIDGKLLGDRYIKIKSSNGTIQIDGSILSKFVSIRTSNATFLSQHCIDGTDIEIKTKNAPVQLGNISLGRSLEVKTSNAFVEVHINDINEKATIDIETSNGPANVYLPRTFSGCFDVKTSRSLTQVICKAEGSELLFETNEDGRKSGICTHYGHAANIHVTVKTSNAPANLYI